MNMLFVKNVFLGTSFTAFILSLIFLLLPKLYLRIEEVLSVDLTPRTMWIGFLEGEINSLNDWIFENRIVFGILFVLLSLYDIRSIAML